MRLLAPPRPIEVASPGPGGPPVEFHWRGRRQVVARHWGPERIETGWWRRGLVRRDYYRVETTEGRRFWLFRDLAGGAWYLHGSFE
jgi:protein ImuB